MLAQRLHADFRKKLVKLLVALCAGGALRFRERQNTSAALCKRPINLIDREMLELSRLLRSGQDVENVGPPRARVLTPPR
ncbi:MAG TPA: hypothetical protein VET25_10125 [Aestuariivirgaceae bacterium]|nr:hypothetical protein [Aestuariivirgaceae bacterium]